MKKLRVRDLEQLAEPPTRPRAEGCTPSCFALKARVQAGVTDMEGEGVSGWGGHSAELMTGPEDENCYREGLLGSEALNYSVQNG